MIASATAGAGTSIASLTILLDGTPLANGSNGVLNATWNTTSADATRSHVLVAKVVDQAGNVVGTAPVTVNLAAPAPAHAGCSAVNGQSGSAYLGLLALSFVLWRRSLRNP